MGDILAPVHDPVPTMPPVDTLSTDDVDTNVLSSPAPTPFPVPVNVPEKDVPIDNTTPSVTTDLVPDIVDVPVEISNEEDSSDTLSNAGLESYTVPEVTSMELEDEFSGPEVIQDINDDNKSEPSDKEGEAEKLKPKPTLKVKYVGK